MSDINTEAWLKEMKEAIFSTAPVKGPRYLWIAHMGHVMIDDHKLYVLSEDGSYLPATEEQMRNWRDFAEKLKKP